MMDYFDILCEAKGDNKFWISPEGEVFSGFDDHAFWLDSNTDLSWPIAFREGWIRGTMTSGEALMLAFDPKRATEAALRKSIQLSSGTKEVIVDEQLLAMRRDSHSLSPRDYSRWVRPHLKKVS